MNKILEPTMLPQNQKPTSGRRRYMALALAGLSLAMLSLGIFFAKSFVTERIALSKAAQRLEEGQFVSHLTAEDVKKEIRDASIQPTNIYIRSLKVNAPVVPVALAPDRSLQVPAGSRNVGWYIHGTQPGSTGPAVLTGHFDTPTGPAVFWHLKEVKPGDIIEISRSDNSIASFKVDRLELYPQDNFPTEKVYGSVDHAALRLITCAGAFNQKTGRYSDNLVVYATLVDITAKSI